MVPFVWCVLYPLCSFYRGRSIDSLEISRSYYFLYYFSLLAYRSHSSRRYFGWVGGGGGGGVAITHLANGSVCPFTLVVGSSFSTSTTCSENCYL